jgi:hypothetical protein
LQSHLQTSPPTPQKSYLKFRNPRTTFEITPFVRHVNVGVPYSIPSPVVGYQLLPDRLLGLPQLDRLVMLDGVGVHLNLVLEMVVRQAGLVHVDEAGGRAGKCQDPALSRLGWQACHVSSLSLCQEQRLLLVQTGQSGISRRVDPR